MSMPASSVLTAVRDDAEGSDQVPLHEAIGGVQVTPSRLSAAPMALFAIVMGLAGAALAWRKAADLFGAPEAIAEALMGVAGLAYVAIVAVQVVRALRFPGAHLAEFHDPARSSFVPAFTVATALMAAGIEPYSIGAARALWVFAAGLHVLLAFLLLRRWFTEPRDLSEASPAWFIPVVGNLLMPVVGVPLGFTVASWFLFSVGAVFWLILAPVMTSRLFFGTPLPEKQVPSLFILLAPPAVGGLAVIALNGGDLSVVSHALLGFGTFIALLTASMIGRVVATHFAIGWWALTFPCAAFANLAQTYALEFPGLAPRLAAGAALAFANLIVAAVAVLTMRALVAGDLVPRPKA